MHPVLDLSHLLSTEASSEMVSVESWLSGSHFLMKGGFRKKKMYGGSLSGITMSAYSHL